MCRQSRLSSIFIQSPNFRANSMPRTHSHQIWTAHSHTAGVPCSHQNFIPSNTWIIFYFSFFRFVHIAHKRKISIETNLYKQKKLTIFIKLIILLSSIAHAILIHPHKTIAHTVRTPIESYKRPSYEIQLHFSISDYIRMVWFVQQSKWNESKNAIFERLHHVRTPKIPVNLYIIFLLFVCYNSIWHFTRCCISIIIVI